MFLLCVIKVFSLGERIPHIRTTLNNNLEPDPEKDNDKLKHFCLNQLRAVLQEKYVCIMLADKRSGPL